MFRGKHLLWQGFFGSYVVGLDRLLPVAAVSCLDDGSDFDLIRDGCNIEFCSVDAMRRRRTNWIGSGIDGIFQQRGPAIRELLRRYPKDSWLLTSSPPCPLMRTFCADLGYRYVGTQPEAIGQFKHKARLFEALDELQLPRIPGSWQRLGARSYEELASEFGSDVVVQQPLGAAGSATALLRSRADLDHLDNTFLGMDVWVAPYLGELSFNINAAVIGDLVCVGFPSVQLAGCEELGAPWGGYCGNDYTAATETDAAIIADVQQQTERVGEWLRSRGFEGVYGLDFVLNPADGRAYAVDLNPRWQGSTALSIQAELEAGRLPLMAALFGAQCGVFGSGDIRPLQESFRKPIRGSQLNLRCRMRVESTVTEPLQPGVYHLAGNLKFKHTAFRLGDLNGDEVLLTGGVPRKGVVVEPGAWLCRLVSGRSVCIPHSPRLNRWAAQAADDVHSRFNFETAEQ
ncbi:MAG: hypothetical protein O2968_08660 [Acidobacteria bacterium]|nr:hypothetical protein [Acidobacteriota bacterium]